MEKIKKIIREIFYFIDPDIKIDFSLQEENHLFIDVKMKEPRALIGEKGQTLSEIERLIKIICRKNYDDLLYINLDINNYKKRKEDYLKSLAKEVADDVSFTGIEKKFPPMSASERRIIHLSLLDREDVTTESVGEKEDRRVLIKKSSSSTTQR